MDEVNKSTNRDSDVNQIPDLDPNIMESLIKNITDQIMLNTEEIKPSE
jgi:hypothetical protein